MSNFKNYLLKAQGEIVNINVDNFINESFANYLKSVSFFNEFNENKVIIANNKKFLKAKSDYINDFKYIEVVAFPNQDKLVLSSKKNIESKNTHDGEQVDIESLSTYSKEISEIVFNGDEVKSFEKLKELSSKKTAELLTGPNANEDSLYFKITAKAVEEIVEKFFDRKNIKTRITADGKFYVSNKKTEIKISNIDLTSNSTGNDPVKISENDLKKINDGTIKINLLDIKIEQNI